MTDREKKQREILEKVYWWNRSSGDGDDEKMFDQALAELAKLDAIPTSKEKILKKYEELTPQGSEFANDSENVYEYIKERLNSASEAKKEVVRLKRELAKSIPTSKEVEEADIEELAEQLHKWYLLAIAWVKKFKDGEPFSHNPDAQKEYKDLSEEQKYIDRYIAKQIIQSYSQISINQV